MLATFILKLFEMDSKSFFLVLLGVTLVLAHPGPEKDLEDHQANELVLRSTFLEKVDEFLKSLIQGAQRLIGEARSQCQKLINLYIEYKEKAKAEIHELIAQLQKRLQSAKDCGRKKFEQVKQECAKALKEKEEKVKAGLKKFQNKIKIQMDAIMDKAPHIEVTAKVIAEVIKLPGPLVTPGPSKTTPLPS